MMWVVLVNLHNKPGGGESLAYRMKLSGVSEPAEMANVVRVNRSSSQKFILWIYFSLSQQNNHKYLLSFTVTNIMSLNVSQ